MGLDPLELLAAVEAVVFVASEPITPQRLIENFPDEDPAAVEAAIEALQARHDEEGRGLVLDRVAGGLRIATRPEVHPHVERYVQRERSERLSLRTLETLSVVAYKQPVTSAEIQEIRGVDPGGTLRTLLDRSLIKIAGRKKVVGRPFVYATTREFLKTFGLNDLSELPSLRELEEFATEIRTTDPGDVEPAVLPEDAETEGLADIADETERLAAEASEGPDTEDVGVDEEAGEREPSGDS